MGRTGRVKRKESRVFSLLVHYKEQSCSCLMSGKAGAAAQAMVEESLVPKADNDAP